MAERVLTGAQALAYGAIEADVRVVIGQATQIGELHAH